MDQYQSPPGSRRTFLAMLGALAAGVFAVFPFRSRAAMQDRAKSAIATVTLSEHERLGSVGGWSLLKDTPKGDLLVVRSAKDTFSVMSNICPHKECKVKVKNTEQIQCPCHKSAYGLDGRYISGPAKRGLTTFPSSVKNGVLTIYTEE